MLPSAEEHLESLGNCVWVFDHAGNRIRVPDEDAALLRAHDLIRADRREVALATITYALDQTAQRNIPEGVPDDAPDDALIDAHAQVYAERLGKGESDA